MRADYRSLPGFEDVQLEGSYVLGIEARPGKLMFRLDLLLDPAHPDYGSPLGGDRACFRPAVLCFDAVHGLTWFGQGDPPARDASGEIDYGCIDEFTWVAGDFALVGDWGRIQVDSLQAPKLDLAVVHDPRP
ncbi:hypothetical protein ACFWH1_28250 [Streptomyces sp. NPDC127037]|uniref:hypothetical protein n=1 Tax=Streptomyces sp. NPDC127037 TaxID=3347113 RepID=UPI00366264EE